MAGKKKIVEKTTAKVETKTPSTKGTDAGTQYSHWTKNPHGVEANIVEVKGGKVNTYKKAGSVYTADFKVIDDTIEEIKKECRRVCKSDYVAKNIYIIVQDALKRVRLSYT